MNIQSLPLLTIITFFPLIGIFIIFFISKKKENLIKVIANIVTALTFLISLTLLLGFDPQAEGMQFVEKVSWIPAIGVQYFMGIDGISLLLILLTTLLTFLATLSSWRVIDHRIKEYYIFMLLLEIGMVGVFTSLDLILFYVFWEVMLVPMYFLIGVWGGERKLYAAIKFFLYTLFGSVLLLLGILALYFYHHAVTGVYTFDALQMMAEGFTIPPKLQFWIFLAFFFGFAIKVPMFPFHTWLPDAHVEAPTAGSVILAGILLKMGTYGFIRFSLPILPDASRKFVPVIVVLSIIAIIYGALVAMMQKDWKSLVAYSSISHMGFVTLGMFALTPIGLQGSIIQQINHGISTGALFLIVGIVYERRHTRLISEYGGLSRIMPVYAAVFAIMMLSSIGLPGLNGFIGEFLILVGTFQVKWWWAAIAASGIILGAAYMLWLYQRVMFGKVTKEENLKMKDLNAREIAYFLPLIFLAFWIGLYPKPFLKVLEKPVNKIVQKVNPDYSQKKPDIIKKLFDHQEREGELPY
ncbi:NADH-quinone oxidoreductase subunit M [Candidatus Aminicenantes bacterium AC-708-M15]|jgi:NADH-quinone oxidoreductase subunit M|nr:NADH-quinone oxidoreductase subunit M [SCandidatus Aminicenantes bacterium Aminicenantia_JdfR_composite]MCP2597523.1 NADH-quinone oxidoreductase subunit M [Candidatus Aminicenantes bacterium AC-335-G13]MCP2598459.1 NADH-quinone oxidoreductase subunit M [Candidatus Aminicenantes bacterium AC-335-L06]MCP2598989.1 NADH-quinone oxidoreductase subunit M [Candidatus Aminicenantes bacterium AC-335-B20]MCP2604171.1 NADH-quinone oxidoreductase subunit M [Candidatus Aminicenantes bacterium AC-708-M15]